MNLTRITYKGGKPYRDREVRYEWAPGDTKLVPDKAARRLLRFPVFALADGAATAAEQEQATVTMELSNQKERHEHHEKEGMLMTIETMDKGALEAYAAKYETKLDKRKGEAALRAEVAGLIEQFGVR
jgi:hypothetical protein